ncbi:hypothetical protein BOX15_Mlig000471g5 [Macrostomum lignano]|uniref:Uncharacterized protein n=1 Tax=Macrostomum lignano TaxID=282301 RepID=A0A267G6V4_9PLAT|nr:hypothetical protein BOX15_Mlig000471g5 [Macrostomum lignano]
MRYGYIRGQEWPSQSFGGDQNAQQTVNNIVNYIRDQKPNARFAKIMAYLWREWKLKLYFCEKFWYVDLNSEYRMLLRPVQMNDGSTYVCIEIYRRQHEHVPTLEEHKTFLNKSSSPEKAEENFPEHTRGNSANSTSTCRQEAAKKSKKN